jgi:glutathione S-transferase
MDWQQTTVMAGLSPLFLGLVRTPPAQRDQSAIAAGAGQVLACMRLLDGHLSHSPYVAGDHPTVADIALGCPTYRWYALPVERPRLPNLERWYAMLAARPAFQAHVMLPLT